MYSVIIYRCARCGIGQQRNEWDTSKPHGNCRTTRLDSRDHTVAQSSPIGPFVCSTCGWQSNAFEAAIEHVERAGVTQP